MALIDTFKGITTAARALWAGNKPGGITSQAFPVQVRRESQNIGTWRAALDRAEAVFYPDRSQLLNVFADAILDTHLSSIIATRKINVLSKAFKLVDGAGNEVPHLTKLLRRPWFRTFADYALDSKFWGHSLMEFDTPVDGEFHKVSLIDRQYVFPEAGIVRTMPGMLVGPNFRDDPQYASWVLEVGELRDLGLLVKAAPWVLWKKDVAGYWTSFVEMFGMPYRALTGSFDEGLIQQYNQMMYDMGAAGYGIFPGDTKVEFLSAPNSTGDLYDKFIERANSELSKLVLGQTMTTDNGSSRSQSEVHERVGEAYTRNDAAWLADIINDKLLPFLLTHGYPLAGITFQWNEAEVLSVEAQWKIVEGVLGQGYKVPAAYLTERFGVPIEIAAKSVAGAADATAPEVRPILGYHIEEGVVNRNEARAQLNLPPEDDSEAEAQQKLKARLSVLQAATGAGVPISQAIKLAGLEDIINLSIPPEPVALPAPVPGKPAGLPAYPTRQARPQPPQE
jgi:hypothetical protein